MRTAVEAATSFSAFLIGVVGAVPASTADLFVDLTLEFFLDANLLLLLDAIVRLSVSYSWLLMILLELGSVELQRYTVLFGDFMFG